jgi:N6-L-threonylcarbamoyladenine synthase
MKILGIETSCDETAAAVVENGCNVLSNKIISSADLHALTGGVIPEIAAREHVAAILPVIKKSLQKAQTSLDKIDAIAVTTGPGLTSSLLAGVVTANTLATFTHKKIIPVNHIFGHVCANFLERQPEEIKFPVVALTVSGGHSDLIFWKQKNSLPETIGETRDDAAGEAFDKIARLLNLSYPGGPAIEKFAKFAKTKKNQTEILPRAWLIPKDYARNFDSVELGQRLRDNRLQLTNFDFSFSGLKSEVRRRVIGKKLTKIQRTNLAAEFQSAVCDVLATKIFLAAQKFQAQEIHLAGGVSANKFLRAKIQKLAQKLKIKFRAPKKMSFCTDNAAMIAGAGFWLWQQKPQEQWKNLVKI